MPYDPGPRRKVKAAAMVNALDKARALHTPPRTWQQVADSLAGYEPVDWRLLSYAAGHPNRTPSEDTQGQVRRSVAAMAEAEQAPPLTDAEWRHMAGGV